MWTGERSVVYIKNSVGNTVEFMLREVTLGPSLGDSYSVVSGLSEGEEIVVNGTFTVDAASQLAGKPSMMNPEGGIVMTGHDHGAVEMETSNKTTKDEINFDISVGKEIKEAIQPLIVAYLEMKDALVGDNLNTAKNSGVKLLSSSKSVDMGLFKGKSHDVWMALQNDIKSELEHAEHFTDLDEARKAFFSLSNTMIALANTFKPDETLFVLHCPMANDNKGADWLSSSKEIRNPYYGEAMLTCGEVKDTIKN